MLETALTCFQALMVEAGFMDSHSFSICQALLKENACAMPHTMVTAASSKHVQFQR